MTKKTHHEIQTKRHLDELGKAAALIRRGLRPSNARGCIGSIVNDKELARLWRQHHNGNAPPGRPPNGADSMIETVMDAAMASGMLVEYLRVANRPELAVDPIGLCVAWDQFVGRVGWAHRTQVEGFATITTMWLLARDYVAKIVRLRECGVCHASHIRCDNWCTPKLMDCPHCRLLESRKNQ